MYVYMASFSSLNRLYSFLVGNGKPGSRVMGQLYGQCGGKARALSLLKTFFKVMIGTRDN